MTSVRYTFLALALVVLQCCSVTAAEGEGEGEEEQQQQEPEAVATAEAQPEAAGAASSSTTPPPPPKERLVAKKDWYLENINIAGIELPFNIVTLVITVVSAYVLFTGLFAEDPTKPKCTASHILVDDSTDATKAKMEAWKKEIGNDKEAFAKYAREHSTCPSNAKGGEFALLCSFSLLLFSGRRRPENDCFSRAPRFPEDVRLTRQVRTIPFSFVLLSFLILFFLYIFNHSIHRLVGEIPQGRHGPSL